MPDQEFRTEPPTYGEIFREEYLHWLALLFGLVCTLIAIFAAAIIVHLHVTELSIIAELEAESEASESVSIASRPYWSYYVTFLIYSAMAAVSILEFVNERREA